MQKVSGAHRGGVLPALAPLDEGLPFENIYDGFLWAMMVYPCAGSRFHQKRSAPKAGTDAQFRADGRVPQRTRCL
jgi:hypothetical protein